jgi:hypothetical protein
MFKNSSSELGNWATIIRILMELESKTIFEGPQLRLVYGQSRSSKFKDKIRDRADETESIKRALYEQNKNP